MLRTAALAALILAGLGPRARAQADEAAWSRNGALFDGIYAQPKPAAESGLSGALAKIRRQAGAAAASKPSLPDARPALSAAAAAKTSAAREKENDPFADRQDFGIASVGIFGLALLGWKDKVKNVFWLTLGATLLVLGYFLVSAAGL